ncbi:hypothetical protein F511_28487 [Dorcoceras hygrometricum]|uniref:Uncharacterized protein n=1 Tax=Dorcoceras hygrometricum TaxID=472368 RepID=A0A2Z7A5G5_9LAMI|nr:hypothetical protein F511_28487 [Dorcoceras hygrometricum]
MRQPVAHPVGDRSRTNRAQRVAAAVGQHGAISRDERAGSSNHRPASIAHPLRAAARHWPVINARRSRKLWPSAPYWLRNILRTTSPSGRATCAARRATSALPRALMRAGKRGGAPPHTAVAGSNNSKDFCSIRSEIQRLDTIQAAIILIRSEPWL